MNGLYFEYSLFLVLWLIPRECTDYFQPIDNLLWFIIVLGLKWECGWDCNGDRVWSEETSHALTFQWIAWSVKDGHWNIRKIVAGSHEDYHFEYSPRYCVVKPPKKTFLDGEVGTNYGKPIDTLGISTFLGWWNLQWVCPIMGISWYTLKSSV